MATNSVIFFLSVEGNGPKLHSSESWLTLWIIKNSTEVGSFKWWILCNVNYVSIKMQLKRSECNFNWIQTDILMELEKVSSKILHWNSLYEGRIKKNQTTE